MSNKAPIILAEYRRQQAVAMRLAGHSYHQIAERLHIHRSSALRAVSRTMKRLNAEAEADCRELRALEAARLDQLQAAVWQAAIEGDLLAVATTLKIMERRAKLLGLDAGPDELTMEAPALNLILTTVDGAAPTWADNGDE